MNFTPGELLFYGGIAGMSVMALLSIVVITVLTGSRNRLRRELDQEYGNHRS